MLIARTYHIQGNLEQASKFYESARETYNREESKMPAALFMGLGQMALHKKELNAAVHYFESGLKKNPESKDLLLMLGSIYANNEKLKKRVEATRYLQRATELDNVDYEARIELANLNRKIHTDSNLKVALKLYKRSIKAMVTAHGKKPAVELVNNVGVLHQHLGDLKSAKTEFIKALQIQREADATARGTDASLKEGEEPTLDTVLAGDYLFNKENVTLTYNTAILLEQTGDSNEAERLHQGILKKFPGYGDCYLRLACLARDRRMFSEAERYLELARKTPRSKDDATCMLGDMRLGRGDLEGAKKLFSELPSHDAYGRISLGNIEFQGEGCMNF